MTALTLLSRITGVVRNVVVVAVLGVTFLGNGVKLDGAVVVDPRLPWSISAPTVLSVGTRRFVRVVPHSKSN